MSTFNLLNSSKIVPFTISSLDNERIVGSVVTCCKKLSDQTKIVTIDNYESNPEEIEKLNSEISNLNTQLSRALSENEQFEISLQTTTTEYRNLQREHGSCVTTINSLNQRIELLESQQEEPDHTECENQILSLNSQLADLQLEHENCESIISEKQSTIESLNSQLASEQQAHANCESTIEEKTNTIDSLNSQLTELQQTHSNCESTITSLNNEILEYQSMTSNLNREISILQSEHATCESTISDLETQVEILTEQQGSAHDECNNTIASLTSQNESLQSELKDAQESVEILTAAISDVYISLTLTNSTGDEKEITHTLKTSYINDKEFGDAILADVQDKRNLNAQTILLIMLIKYSDGGELFATCYVPASSNAFLSKAYTLIHPYDYPFFTEGRFETFPLDIDPTEYNSYKNLFVKDRSIGKDNVLKTHSIEIDTLTGLRCYWFYTTAPPTKQILTSISFNIKASSGSSSIYININLNEISDPEWVPEWPTDKQLIIVWFNYESPYGYKCVIGVYGSTDSKPDWTDIVQNNITNGPDKRFVYGYTEFNDWTITSSLINDIIFASPLLKASSPFLYIPSELSYKQPPNGHFYVNSLFYKSFN